MRKLLVLGVAVCALCGCATMYYKPGATAQEGKEAVYNCERDVSQSRLGGLSNGVLFRDCMNAQGWYSGTRASATTIPAPAPPVSGADQLALALPPGFALKAVPDNLKNAGAALYAVNRTLDIGMSVMPVPHEEVTDLTAFASTKKAAQVDRLKDGTSSEVARLEVGGRNAVRYSVTGTSKNLKITCVTTLIEGHDLIVIVNAWAGATNAQQQMTLLESLAATVSGIS